MIQRLSALAVLAKDVGSVFSNHMTAHSTLSRFMLGFMFSLRDLACVGTMHTYTHSTLTYIQAKYSYT